MIKKATCYICKKTLGSQEACYVLRDRGFLCVACGDKEIDVFRVSPADDPKNCYCEKDVGAIMDMVAVAEVDEGYTITKQRMKQCRYYNLAEFNGF